ncbi:MAG: hypothetical protein Q7S84_04060 [bacterium]|nr:hypothetical protein [bacterium]
MLKTRNYAGEYALFLRTFLAPARPLRVVFDFSNGPAGIIVPDVVRSEPNLTAFFVDRALSGNFPGHGPNPLAGAGLLHLHTEVLARHANLGLIFDADGDRVFVVDERGRWVPPHLVAHLLARRAATPFVFDTRTALALRYAGLFEPAAAILSPVGSVYIKERMRASGAGFGAEYSGHYYFKEFLSVDSGILAAVNVLNAVSRLPYSLAEFVDLAPRDVRFEERNMPTKKPRVTVAALTSALRPGARRVTPAARMIGVQDGMVIEADAWFATVRPSNTEPLVRVCVGSIEPRITKEKRVVLAAFSV